MYKCVRHVFMCHMLTHGVPSDAGRLGVCLDEAPLLGETLGDKWVFWGRSGRLRP
jgi:hypothetical protein